MVSPDRQTDTDRQTDRLAQRTCHQAEHMRYKAGKILVSKNFKGRDNFESVYTILKVYIRNNTIKGLRAMDFEGNDWVQLAQNRYHWPTVI